jgi:hypothetical protein
MKNLVLIIAAICMFSCTKNDNEKSCVRNYLTPSPFGKADSINVYNSVRYGYTGKEYVYNNYFGHKVIATWESKEVCDAYHLSFSGDSTFIYTGNNIASDSAIYNYIMGKDSVSTSDKMFFYEDGDTQHSYFVLTFANLRDSLTVITYRVFGNKMDDIKIYKAKN